MEWSEKDDDDCWEGRTFVGINAYDTHILPICSEVEEGRVEPKDGGCFSDEDYSDLSEEDQDRISEEAEGKGIGCQPEDDFCDYDQNCEWTTATIHFHYMQTLKYLLYTVVKRIVYYQLG
jgi:hypothetical protein